MERQDFVNLEEDGSEWVWDQCECVWVFGSGDYSAHLHYIMQCSGAVWLRVEWFAVF